MALDFVNQPGGDPIASGPLSGTPPAAVASADNPPFNRARWIALTAAIALAWQPAVPAAQPSRHFVVQGAVVTADPPPPTSTARTLATILAAWQPGPPPSQPQEKVVQGAAAAPADAPPPLQRVTLSAIVQAWQPVAPPVQPERILVPQAPAVVNNPPFGTRRFARILATIRQ